MIQVLWTRRFLVSSRKLSKKECGKLDSLLGLLSNDPFHPLLHTKRLAGAFKDCHSFRIGRDWRVIFMFASVDTIKLLDIGNRKDIYR